MLVYRVFSKIMWVRLLNWVLIFLLGIWVMKFNFGWVIMLLELVEILVIRINFGVFWGKFNCMVWGRGVKLVFW